MEQTIALLESIAQADGCLRAHLERGNLAAAGALAGELPPAIQTVAERLARRASLPSLPESIPADASGLGGWLDQLEHWLWHALWYAENLRIEQPASLKPRCALDRQFLSWIEEIRVLPQEKLFSRIQKHFLAQSPEDQQALEVYFKTFTFWGSLDREAGDFTIWQNKAESFYAHWRDYLWLYQRLEDYRSRQLLFGIVNNWYRQDYHTLALAVEYAWPDYFDPDLMPCDENEVLVDLGAYNGDTVLEYMKVYGRYKKIYCYEITPATFRLLRQVTQKFPQIECRMKGAGKERGQMFISANPASTSANVLTGQGNIPVEVVSIDEDIAEPITFIKMDIEGAEQSALLGCSRHIQREHPKLAISVYHNNEDIWKIPRMIDEICPGYRFWLRYHGGNRYPTEISLLAVYGQTI